MATQSKRVAVLAAAVLVRGAPTVPARRPAGQPRRVVLRTMGLRCSAADRTTTPPTRAYLLACTSASACSPPISASVLRLLRVAWHPSRGLRSLAAGQSWEWVSRRLVSLELEVSYRLPFRINKQEMDHGWMDGYGVHVLGG